MPEDILPARGVNLLLGLCFLGLAGIPGIPIYGTLKYDGFGDILDWPSVFYWFAAFLILFVGLGLKLLFSPQRVGAEVSFHEDGFAFEVRRFLLRDQSYRLAWSDIEEMKAVEAPRGGDAVSFRLSQEAALKHGLVKPTTRIASKKLVKCEVALPISLSAVTIDEAIKRFQASAEHAGAKLVEQKSFNILVVSRKIWSVEWP